MTERREKGVVKKESYNYRQIKEIEGEKGKREKKFHLTAYQEKQSFCKFKVFFTEEYK